MNKLFALALLGALLAGPALAGGTQKSQQSGMSGQESSQQQQAMSQETVRDVQEQLKQKGYDVGQVDGQYGASTRQALQQFQRDQGLNPSGQADQQTLSALGISPENQQAQTPGSQQQMDKPEQKQQYR